MIVSGEDKWTQPPCTHIHSPSTDFHVLASSSRNFKAKTQAQLQSDFHPAPGIFFWFKLVCPFTVASIGSDLLGSKFKNTTGTRNARLASKGSS